jgi:RNA polymerase sigma factor (sigma-70 family)
MVLDWSKASNEQLWVIIRSDSECPLTLLEGVFREAVNRGMIEHFILSIIKKKGLASEKARMVLEMSHEDLIQLGYEGALKAIRDFQTGKGTFSSLLFLAISQAYGKQFQYVESLKRQREEVSYNSTISGENTMEYYLIDNRTNVEKTVIMKLYLEEKLSLLSPIQIETFQRFFIGYTYNEIAEQMNTKKSTVARRMEAALIRMTGKNINLAKLGLIERVSFKKQGA